MPVGEAVNPQRRLRHPDDVRPDRGARPSRRGLEGANFFGYSLGPLLRLRRAHVRATTDVWAEFIERRDEQGYSPDVEAAA